MAKSKGSSNLIPEAHKLTAEDRREGGRKAGEAKRRKRDLRAALEALLEKDYKGKNGEILSGAEAIAIKQMEKALRGDTRAFAMVRDTAGQMPVQKIETTVIDDETRREIEDFIDSEEEKAPPEAEE